MLGVGLGEHHQFDVVRIAPQAVETADQVIDFVFGQGQAQLDVGLFQGGAATAEHIHRGQRLGFGVTEQRRGVLHIGQHQLGHAVMQQVRGPLQLGFAQLAGNVVGDAALDALDLRQAAVARDVAGLARPGRDGAETRNTQQQTAARLLHRHTRTVLEQPGQHLFFIGAEHPGDIGKMRELGIQPSHSGYLAGQLLEQFTVAESRKGGSAAQDQHGNSLWEGGVLRTVSGLLRVGRPALKAGSDCSFTTSKLRVLAHLHLARP
ncbi:hypothetical protein D3C85_613650 [compost metagenome]